MFNRLKSMLPPPEQKASRTARLIAIASGGRARWTPRDFAALTREGDRSALWQRVTKAPFLTVNEKRAATGYGEVTGGDVFQH
jgi:phage portal protein BeeE